VLPSEDELAEALLNGEIDSVQYDILLDIIENGIDSTNRYLLDEIPNLVDIGISEGSFIPSLETEQEDPFKKDEDNYRMRLGVAKYRFYQDLNDSHRTKYYSSVTLDFNHYWNVKIKINRDLDGQERFTERTIIYKNKQGTVKKLTLGNYTARFGLGTVYGYHSRLFDCVNGLEKESFLFPDNSAFNGGYAELKTGSLDIRTLAAVDRDTVFQMTSLGTMLSYPRGKMSWSIILGLNRLKKRDNNEFIDDNKIGLYSRYEYSTGYATFEICGGVGDQENGGAVMVEGRHHFGPAELRYSGWNYAENYRDLTAGSRSAGIRRTREIEALGFEYSDKRAAQAGLLLKTVTRPWPQMELFNSMLAAVLNDDTSNVDFLTGLTQELDNHWEISVDYLYKNRKRVTDLCWDITHENRIRLETKFKTGHIILRNYIALNKKTDDEDYFSFFTGLKIESSDLGNIEIWSNCRLLNGGSCEYWYMYLKSAQRVNKNLSVTVKFGNRYSRDGEVKHRPYVSFDLKAII